MSSSTDRRTLRETLVFALAIACSAQVACSAEPQADPAQTTTSLQMSSTVTATTTASPRPTRAKKDPLLTSFAEAMTNVPGTASVSVWSGKTLRHFGFDVSGPAWSTIKVPLAIAAVRQQSSDTDSLVTAAITQSDNASAESLWSSLGPPTVAAQAVQDVLRDSGDSSTIVESQRIRSGFTAFGQTQWPVDAQAQFAWELPCIPQAARVLRSMRNLVPGQQWGLARSDTAAAKGGWGPDPDGNYLVRQIGVVDGTRGSLGVSIAVRPDDGSFATGVAAIDVLARWVIQHKAGLAVGDCTVS